MTRQTGAVLTGWPQHRLVQAWSRLTAIVRNGTFVRTMTNPSTTGRATTKSNARALEMLLDPASLANIQALLVDWFEQEGRDLPWRRTRDPWRIMVAEVMLQQIQVARAIPFWERFLAAFPTPESLAAAPLSAAIRVWGDLGRYRRVADLHRTACLIVDDHKGRVPSDPAVLRALPGIGPYTAGAIACFAFERDVSFVDTNIRRVLHRLFVGVENPPGVAPPRMIVEVAAKVLPDGRAWAWNQALMDLGATVCTPRKPACDRCPVRVGCRARPAIASLLVTAHSRQRHATGTATPRYEGTNRYYRGRVLERLRAVPADDDERGLPLSELGAGIRADFSSSEHLPWIRGVVESLEKDGLAVAEERPTYDDDGRRPDDLVVKLPGRTVRPGDQIGPAPATEESGRNE